MNDAQIWTVLGVFVTVLVGYSTLTLALVRAELRVFRTELRSQGDKLVALDRDVHAVIVHMMGGDA